MLRPVEDADAYQKLIDAQILAVTTALEKVTANSLKGRAERLWRETARLFDDVPGVNDPQWIKDARHEVFVEAFSWASDPVALANDNTVSERTIYDWKRRPSFGMGVVGYFDQKRRALIGLEKRAWAAIRNPGLRDDVPEAVYNAAFNLRNVADPMQAKRAEREFEKALA